MQEYRREALLKCIKKQPQTLQQILNSRLWESVPVLSQHYARKLLKDMANEGLIRKLEIEGELYYGLNPLTGAEKLAGEVDDEWLKLLAVAQPIVREWQPYVPTKETPHRLGADDHLKWKSLGTP